MRMSKRNSSGAVVIQVYCQKAAKTDQCVSQSNLKLSEQVIEPQQSGQKLD